MAMEEYFSAVQKMEQLVLFPSLLRGVFVEQDETATADFGEKDLYEHYLQLKSIKLAVEGAQVPREKCKLPVTNKEEKKENRGDANLEELFYHHFTGLYHVLMTLTRKANALTRKYNDIIGEINQNDTMLTW
ncbi:thyroid hormone responsive [Alligator mississippiensis]|uniref:Thyroid hormone responsive n=1 Tax=Alligator mississippiensis TaxID=8496 RepID=A0A151N518_ALLMI|nr:thyroid hormone responsive [Alligator mississippiensis]